MDAFASQFEKMLKEEKEAAGLFSKIVASGIRPEDQQLKTQGLQAAVEVFGVNTQSRLLGSAETLLPDEFVCETDV
jgi:hypothetical protein